MTNLVDILKITFHLSSIGNDTLKKLRNGAFWVLLVLNGTNFTYIHTNGNGKLKCETKDIDKPSEITLMTDHCLNGGFLYPMDGEPNIRNKTNIGRNCISKVNHNEFK